MHPDVKEILCTEEQIKAKVSELGTQITKDYAGKTNGLTLICILRGSCVFTADLCRAIELPMQIDFMSVSSYQNGTTSTGRVQIVKDLSDSIEGRDVIIVEDILDSGNTLYYLKDLLAARKPNSIKLCTLLDKPDRRVKPIASDYCGFTIPDAFVVGYGLDYAERYRNLPYVGVLKPSVYGGE